MTGIRSGPRHFFRLTIIERFLKESLNKGTVLDAGCGDGSLSIRMAKKGFFVYAVDGSQEWCNVFKGRLKSRVIKERIKIFCTTLDKIGFNPGLFDAVVCSELLEHTENDVETLTNFYSLLKKDGILILSLPLANKGWDIWDTIAGHVRLYILQDLISVLENIGFKIVKVLGWGYPFTKLYNKFIFTKWANKAKAEDEIKKPKHFITHIGKSYLVSIVLSVIFL